MLAWKLWELGQEIVSHLTEIGLLVLEKKILSMENSQNEGTVVAALASFRCLLARPIHYLTLMRLLSSWKVW